MELGEVTVGRTVRGKNRKGGYVTGKVESIDTSGQRGAFVALKSAEGHSLGKFRPSQLSAV